MLFGVCVGPCYEQAKQNLLNMESRVDGAEIRLDTFSEINVENVRYLISGFRKKVIFTYRSTQNKEDLLSFWKSMLSLRPDYIDLDYQTEEDVRELVITNTYGTKLILSYHDYLSTNDIRSIFDMLIKKPSHIIKIATFANNTIDSLQMLELVKYASDKKINFIGICMGEYGAITRILAPVFGSFLNYACCGEHSSAPGQIDVDTLLSIYNYNRLSKTSAIYALIGDPVDHSIGHLVHNYLFSKKKVNAVYVKIRIKKEEVSDFFSLFRRLDSFKGLSITMPLKENCIDYVDELSQTAAVIGAINTITKNNERLLGDNTDCDGALIAIDKIVDVKTKNVLIIGSGGAAKAAAYGLRLREANIWVWARNNDAVRQMIEKFSCKSLSLDMHTIHHFSLVINTLPPGVQICICPRHKTDAIMDVSYTNKNSFIDNFASHPQPASIYGLDMFLFQLFLQQKIWISFN